MKYRPSRPVTLALLIVAVVVTACQTPTPVAVVATPAWEFGRP